MNLTIAMILLSAVPLAFVWGWMTGSGVIASSVFGGLWGVGMAAVMVFAQRRLTSHPPDVPGEQVVFRSPANHLRKAEGVGGWLLLTDKRLVFMPHKLNVQTEEWSVPVERVKCLEPRSTAWVIPNGLRAVTDYGEERFVVGDRTRWVEEFRLFGRSNG